MPLDSSLKRNAEKEVMFMTSKPFIRPLLVFSLPVLILLAMIVRPTWTAMAGEEIRIQTAPIDPDDLFRGSYVALSYEIETVSSKQLDAAIFSDFKRKNEGEYRNVYVQLKKGEDQLYHADHVSYKNPKKGIFLKGKLQIPYDFAGSSPIQIEYGLDNYYVPKEKAEKLESSASVKPAIAIIKLKNGHVVLKEILIP